MDSNVLAIDFGTSNSVVAYATQEGAHPPISLDSFSHDPSIVRSILYFNDDQAPIFGQKAINNFTKNECEGRLLRSIKKFLPQESFKGTTIANKFYSIENLLGSFIRHLKINSEKTTGKKFSRALLGRPARFSFNEELDKLAQNRLEKAARQAGFNDIHFLEEPVAAAQDFKRTLTDTKLIAVIDLGGGTSDFTILRLSPKAFNKNDVLSMTGISLAGDSLDSCIMKHGVAPHLGSELNYKFPFSNNTLKMPPLIKDKLLSPPDVALMKRTEIQDFIDTVQRSAVNEIDKVKIDKLKVLIEDNLGFPIYEAIESCKRESCTEGKSLFNFDYPEVEIEQNIDYEEFENWCSQNTQLIFEQLDQAAKNAGVDFEQIDQVCMTGGTSKVPFIYKNLQKRFKDDQLVTHENFHSVSMGLAKYAYEELIE